MVDETYIKRRKMDGQIIVIGAGAAGLSAALSLAEKNIKVLI